MATIAGITVDIGANLDDLKRGIAEATNRISGMEKSINASSSKIDEGFAKIGKGIGAAFAVDKLLEFGAKVIDVTSEFQKLDAVLTNTLGSQAASSVAFQALNEFAAKTPFSVKEATEAFLKLQNSGVKPTIDEMRAFADVAANAGKGLDFFAEAVNDATRGEFERLKEFYIDAKVNGDKVALTFRNQTTEVANNSAAIKEYLVSLGNLNGVAGATDAISATLGGKINNLGDSFDRLFSTIGNGTSGVLTSLIDVTAEIVEGITLLASSNEDLGKRFSAKQLGTELSNLEKIYTDIGTKAKAAGQDVNAAISDRAASQVSFFTTELEKAKQKLAEFQEQNNGITDKLGRALDPVAIGSYNGQLGILSGEVEKYKGLIEAVPSIQQRVAQSFTATATASIGLIAALEKQIKAEKEAGESANSAGAIAASNAKVKALGEQLEAYRKLGTQNSLEIVTEKLEKYYAVLSNPDASNSAVSGAIAHINALEKEKETIDRVTEANLRRLKSFQQVVEPIKTASAGQGGGNKITADNGAQGASLVNVPTLDADAIAAKMDYLKGKSIEVRDQYMEISENLVDASESLRGALTGAFVGIGEIIGSAIAGTLDSMGGAFNAILGLVASFMKQFGTALISAGVAALAFENLLLAPPAAIIAGIALVAAATLVSSLLSAGPAQGAKGFAAGGVVFGPTLGMVGEGSGTSRTNPEIIAPLDKLKNFMPGGNGGGEVRFVIEGEALAGVQRNYERGRDRRG